MHPELLQNDSEEGLSEHEIQTGRIWDWANIFFAFLFCGLPLILIFIELIKEAFC